MPGFSKLEVSVVNEATPKSQAQLTMVSPAGGVLRSVNCVGASSQIPLNENRETGALWMVSGRAFIFWHPEVSCTVRVTINVPAHCIGMRSIARKSMRTSVAEIPFVD